MLELPFLFVVNSFVCSTLLVQPERKVHMQTGSACAIRSVRVQKGRTRADGVCACRWEVRMQEGSVHV